MSKKEDVLDMATDLANCIPADINLKMRFRRLVLRLAKTAIKAQELDPSTLASIENWLQT